MLPQEVIARKRDRQALSAEEIAAFVAGVPSGTVSEGQVAALAMAVYLNGMSRDEAVALTIAMRDSGDVLDWSDLDGPVLDKHSTGGVGDNVSLMLAPAIAACGGFNPMISGRGLGHTGGTLDKFDSIPGYQTQPDNALFRKVVNEVGCAVIGQTGNLAPADKVIYGIRDVTATVESVPLITASILSKKLAAGLDALVLDVKVGSGAFMATLEKARELATSLVEVANGAGMKTSALLTAMEHPLASCAGNGVEMRNAVEFLTGHRRDAALYDVTVALGAEMLVSGGLAADPGKGAAMMRDAFDSGRAAEKFGRMVSALGGPADFIERLDTHLNLPPVEVAVEADAAQGGLAGRLGFDTRQIGLAVVELGGGRTRPQDPVDPDVGLVEIAGRDWDGRSPVCRILARDAASAGKARRRILAAMREAGPEQKPVIERIAP
ncbi:MAG: thymidine phosphorylase [Nitratireductor sp.]|nr:thymidine phosphorylase [Nitratireductor sp.]